MLSFAKVRCIYLQALSDGYSTEQAATYGVLIGASEGALQYLLGGISKLGGVSSQQLLTKLTGIENGLLRAAVALGIKGLSEVGEEELQLVLQPLYRSIVFGEDYDAPTVEEFVYTAIISFMMTGVIESGDIASYARKRPANAVGFDFSQDDSWFGAADTAVDPGGDVGYDGNQDISAAGASEADARGAMVLLNLDQFDGANPISEINNRNNVVQLVDTGDLKVVETKPAQMANDEWISRGYDKAPYNLSCEVKNVQAGNEQFVRVFSYNADGTSNKLGFWLMRKGDVDGLTPREIADKFALPKVPTHICDVIVDPEIVLQTGIANSVEGWGNGGGQQFDTMGVRLPRTAFINERLIGE